MNSPYGRTIGINAITNERNICACTSLRIPSKTLSESILLTFDAQLIMRFLKTAYLKKKVVKASLTFKKKQL